MLWMYWCCLCLCEVQVVKAIMTYQNTDELGNRGSPIARSAHIAIKKSI
jgi:hypothetical protein